MTKAAAITIDQVKPYEKNAKLHPQKHLKQIAASIAAFGCKQPIVLDAEGVIIAGHGRFAAMKDILGYTVLEMRPSTNKGERVLPYVLATDLTPAEVRAYRLADNQLNALTGVDKALVIEELKAIDAAGIDVTLTGFEHDLIVDGDKHDDDLPTLPTRARTKNLDVYEFGGHRLVCGDSTTREPYKTLLGNAEVDLVLTDPPYNVNYKGKGKQTTGGMMNDDLEHGAFQTFITAAIGKMRDATKDGAGWYVFHSSTTQDQFKNALDAAGLEVKAQLIWNKPSAALGGGDYRSKHEPFFYAQARGVRAQFYGDRTNGTVIDLHASEQKLLEWVRRQKEAEREGRTTIWTMRRESTQTYLHPTQKPVELLMHALKNSSKHGDLVMDPFAGSGSVAIACQKLDRKARLIELDPKFCDVIIQRYVDYTGDTAIKKNGKKDVWKPNKK